MEDVETETMKFGGCRDRDSSRLRNFEDVKTETHRDSKIWRMSRPRPTETHQKVSRPRPRVSLLTEWRRPNDDRWNAAQSWQKIFKSVWRMFRLSFVLRFCYVDLITATQAEGGLVFLWFILCIFFAFLYLLHLSHFCLMFFTFFSHFFAFFCG